MYLDVNHIKIDYDHNTIIRDLSLHLYEGEIGCLLGQSGSGKSTILRAIAGFITVSQGNIQLGGQLLSGKNRHIPAYQRQIGMVFQDYALFPHLTVEENISFGLHHWKKNEKQTRVDHLLKLIQLNDYKHVYPHQLSGGQQQRVALARAIAPKPKVLLLDEPFSNLDASLREHLAIEIRTMLKQEGITALWVTHDQTESFNVADKIGIMENGAIKQWATPQEIYQNPANKSIASFVGLASFIDVEIEQENIWVKPWNTSYPLYNHSLKGTHQLLLRPDYVVYDKNSLVKACIEDKRFYGLYSICSLRLADGKQVYAQIPSHYACQTGEWIGVSLHLPKQFKLFEKQN